MAATRWVVVLAFAIGAGAWAAAAQSASPTLKNDVQPIFDRACAECHRTDRARGRLDLSATNAYTALVGAAADGVPQMLRVKPGDPERSHLWLKLNNRASKGSGMPRRILGWRALPDRELTVIKAWIESGARQ